MQTTADSNGTSLKQRMLTQSSPFSALLLKTSHQIKFQRRLLINKRRIRSSKTHVIASFILHNVIERYLHERKQKSQPLDAWVCLKTSSKSFVYWKCTFISFFFKFFLIYLLPSRWSTVMTYTCSVSAITHSDIWQLTYCLG